MLWAKDHGIDRDTIATHLGISVGQVDRICDDIDQKRRATAYLHAPPLLLEPAGELPHLPSV